MLVLFGGLTRLLGDYRLTGVVKAGVDVLGLAEDASAPVAAHRKRSVAEIQSGHVKSCQMAGFCKLVEKMLGCCVQMRRSFCRWRGRGKEPDLRKRKRTFYTISGKIVNIE